MYKIYAERKRDLHCNCEICSGYCGHLFLSSQSTINDHVENEFILYCYKGATLKCLCLECFEELADIRSKCIAEEGLTQDLRDVCCYYCYDIDNDTVDFSVYNLDPNGWPVEFHHTICKKCYAKNIDGRDTIPITL